MGQTKRRFHISTLVARGATRQQYPSYLNHPQLAIDRTGAYVASDSLYVGNWTCRKYRAYRAVASL